MKLYELTQAYQDLIAFAENCNDEADLTAFRDTMEGLTGELNEKLENCAKVVKTIEAQEKAIDEERKRLTDRADALAASSNRLKSYMTDAMKLTDTKKVKGELFTIALQKNPPRVAVENEAEIPDSFFKIERTLVRSSVGEALKAGTVVPGCHLEYGESLRIR
jgi:predicted ribosome quality control (RQC) complex YloA/Tae2 family protein